MRHLTVLRRALLAGAALSCLALATGCGGHDGMGDMDHGGTRPSSVTAAAEFNAADVTFAQQMIPHHQQAVQMATLAATQASDPEVKALAAAIKAAQDPQIATLSGWLTTWAQPSAAPSGHNMPGTSDTPGMVSDADMAGLKAASGRAFDVAFTRLMIAHHEGAITMARSEQINGIDFAARKLASAIEKSQSHEVDQLDQILSRL